MIRPANCGKAGGRTTAGTAQAQMQSHSTDLIFKAIIMQEVTFSICPDDGRVANWKKTRRWSGAVKNTQKR
jgi:uncharacterized protein involved in type VI secretion and phage assembly